MATTKNPTSTPEPIEVLNQKEAFILKYKNAIIACVVILVIAILGFVMLKRNARSNQEKASTELATAQELFSMALQANDSVMFSTALNGDSTGVAGFLQVIDEYGSTDIGNTANLYAGLCYAHMGQWQEAANYLEKFDGVGDQMISPAALGALGDVYAHLEQLDKAVSSYKKAADKANNYTISPLYLVKAGEILESQGNKAEALKLYQQVKAKYPQWAQYQVIDEYIERAAE